MVEKRKTLTLCGDVHGNIPAYIHLVKDSDYSIQLGDLGFNYKPSMFNISSEFHKVVAGNHDNYTLNEGVFIHQTAHFLGNFGVHVVPNIGSFFFVRGGQSIDRDERIIGINWWPEEELNYFQCANASKYYEEIKPDIVVSHECPKEIIPFVSTIKRYKGRPIGESKTSLLLQNMIEIHRPRYWFFGHYHVSWSREIDGTQFRCLNELEIFNISEGGIS